MFRRDAHAVFTPARRRYFFYAVAPLTLSLLPPAFAARRVAIFFRHAVRDTLSLLPDAITASADVCRC